MSGERLTIPFVVEGDTDVPFATKVIRAAGGEPGTAYVCNGKPSLVGRLAGFANAARHRPYLALIDLDRDHGCGPRAKADWASVPENHLVLRVVVHAIEAWALGDHELAAQYFKVKSSAVPEAPEEIDDPKGYLVDLCRRSSRRELVRDMVPRRGSGRKQGPGFERRLIEFGAEHWRLDAARTRCPSLDSAVEGLRRALDRCGS